MRAMVMTEFGEPDVLEEQEIEDPEPGPNDVLVRVKATSVNPVDHKIRRDGRWAGIEPPEVLGYDVSGVVDRVGSEVRDLVPGDEVFYTPEIGPSHGSDAELHVAAADIVARKPPSLDHGEAASLPLAGGTAHDALVGRAGVRPGETVLIHGGSGGVGSLAVQIARAAGARVLTTCGGYDAGWVSELGAHRVIDHRNEDFVEAVDEATGGEGADVVFDTVGGDLLERSVRCAADRARFVSIVGTDGSLGAAKGKNITVHHLFLTRARGKLDVLRRLVEDGRLEPVVDDVVDLARLPEAHQRLETEHGIHGKIVLRP